MSEIQSEQIEIIQEFITETRDMHEQLEPIIIELGQDIRAVECWEVVDCGNDDCLRHSKHIDLPCWLHLGHIETGQGTCVVTDSKKDCLACEAFQRRNGDPETINAIFRLFHSMKGSAGFLELEHITKVAHSAENLLDQIRNGGILFDQSHVTLLCEACDFTKAALDYLEDNFVDDGMSDDAQAISSKLSTALESAKALIKEYQAGSGLGDADPEPGRTEDTIAHSPEGTIESEEFDISPEMQERFVQEADELLQAFEQGILKWLGAIDDLDLVSDPFRNMHSFKGDCGFFGYADIEKLSHHIETLLDAVKSNAKMDNYKVAKVLLELIDVLSTAISSISEGGSGNISNIDIYIELIDSYLPKGWLEDKPGKREGNVPLGDILIDQGVIDEQDVDEVLTEQRRPFGEILVDKGAATKEQIEVALEEQKKTRPKVLKPKPKITAAPVVKRQDIRVDLVKLDNLINIIGELVIAENVVVNNKDIKGLQLENFNKASQQMNKLIRGLQEMAMVIRMVPVAGLFRRMIRLVHDLSSKSGKKVALKLVGEETELDKTIIETITDPLVHIIRNSLDHGLETPDERANTDKPATGTVTLTAMHEEGEVWITIDDDGRGLNREKIVRKAISKGLIDGDGANMSNREVFQFVFQPGFSTADKITDVSGRGVGMDVVMQNLKKINGKVSVESKEGVGTRITLRIPLTLAIIEGMVLRVSDTKCILPILSIKENFRPTPELITVTPDGDEIVRVRDRFFPVLRMHKVLGRKENGHALHDGILVLVEAHEKSICLFVDELLGQQQTVIKGLSNYIGNVKGISGCTILGDGEVSLILDAASLIEIADV